uniref:Uncharacterized protein n=1 Tax=Rhizophora mucronata TaxID=61149 RepID=A0A2P2NXX5_RHIMU
MGGKPGHALVQMGFIWLAASVLFSFWHNNASFYFIFLYN